jgi:glutamyl-tRNA reductase
MRPNVPIFDDRLQRYAYSELPAVEHLFAVACSLRSQLLGDTQISRQLAGAIQLARTAGTSGAYLNRAVDSALRCAKLVRSSTGLSAGGDGLGAEVMRILKIRFPRAEKIVVSGTGALATEILGVLSRASQHSSARTRMDLCGVWSSSAARSKSCAETFGVPALSDPEFIRSLSAIDVLILAGAGPHPVVRPDSLRDRMSPLLILDLGLPRNLVAEEFPATHAIIRDIDSVQRSVAENRARRQQAMEKAHALIQLHAGRFVDRSISRFQTPFRAESYRTVEGLIEQMRPVAPDQASRLRVAMHRLLAEFYEGCGSRRFA